MNRPQAHLDRAGQARRILSLLTAGILASCGGGGDSGPSDPSQPNAHAAGIAAPAAAQWSPLIPLTIIPAAAANLPNGKVMFWASYARFSYGGTGQTYTDMFDPVTQLVTETLISQTNHDMFCPGTANLSDGSILVNGG